MTIPSSNPAANTANRDRAIKASAPFAVVEFDDQGQIFAWNAAAERVFGFTAEEATKKNVADLLHSDAATDILRQNSSDNGTHKAILPCVDKYGARIECEWHVCTLESETGESQGRCAYLRDVTAEVESAQAFTKQTNLLRRVLDNMPIVLWSCDPQGKFTFSDGSGLKALGLKPGQVVGLDVFELYASVEAILPLIHDALAGLPSQITTQVGDTHWENRLIPAIAEDGTIEGMIAISWDITARVEADKSLHQKLDLIEVQERAIRTLSTPIMRVWREVLALPLVGSIDESRAEQILGTLLEAVVRDQAQYVIMDMTGIGQVDTSTADHLFRVLRALGLLGANAIVTGIKPGVAQTLVELGVDMSSVITFGYLEEALRFVMKSQNKSGNVTQSKR